MEEEELHSIVYSDRVIAFVAVANAYCDAIESVRSVPVEESVRKLQKLLPLLYLKASVLPKPEKVLEESLEKYVTEVDYHFWQQQWMEALGEHDTFLEVFDPEIQFGTERVTASVSENLLDIYQDLKDFLLSYRLGDDAIMNDSLSDCLFHFESFWGQRLVNVLRAVHKLVVENVVFYSSGKAEEQNLKNPETGSPEWLDNFWGTRTDDD